MSDSESEYRDMTIPYTEKELEYLVQFFKSLPSYKNDAASVGDFPEILKGLKFKRSPEQVQAYQNYWKQLNGGTISLSDFVATVKSLHNRMEVYHQYASRFDTDKDGLIDAEEFKHVWAFFSAHDPTVAGLTYEEFMKEADTNRDGHISIQECAEWIEKRAPSLADP